MSQINVNGVQCVMSGFVANFRPLPQSDRMTLKMADGTIVEASIGNVTHAWADGKVDDGQPSHTMAGNIIGTPHVTYPRRQWRALTFRERRAHAAVRRTFR